MDGLCIEAASPPLVGVGVRGGAASGCVDGALMGSRTTELCLGIGWAISKLWVGAGPLGPVGVRERLLVLAEGGLSSRVSMWSGGFSVAVLEGGAALPEAVRLEPALGGRGGPIAWVLSPWGGLSCLPWPSVSTSPNSFAALMRAAQFVAFTSVSRVC